MQYGGTGDGVGPGVSRFHNIFPTADASAADNRDVHSLGHGPDQFKVHAALQPLTIHAGQQYFPRAEGFAALGPLYDVVARMGAAVVIVRLPAGPGAAAL